MMAQETRKEVKMNEKDFLEFMAKQPDSVGKAWAMMFYWSTKLILEVKKSSR